MMRRTILCFLLILFFFSLAASEPPENDLDAQREIFILAEHALKNNDLGNYQRLSQQITSYPLYPYLVSLEIKQLIQLSAPSEALLKEIDLFEKLYPDFPSTYLLRNAWLSKAAAHKEWALFMAGYRPTKNEELQCSYYFGQYQLTQDPTYLAQAKSLWLVGHSQAKACEPLFQAWRETGGLTDTLIWERIQLALAEKNFKLATHLSKALSTQESQYVAHWEKILKDPTLLNKPSYLESLPFSEPLKTQLISQGMQSLAKKDLALAVQWWETHHKKYAFSEEQINKIKRMIGLALAQQKNPQAFQWLAELSPGAVDSMVQEWQIRLALHQEDWASALKWIHQLPPSLRQEKIWLYWQARALEGIGQYPKALPIYTQLAETRNYYGFLASLRLKRPLSLQHQPQPMDKNVLINITALPAIQRFQQLMLLKRPNQARTEWQRAIEKMNEKELVGAAHLAYLMEFPELIISTIAKSQIKNDITLRFPLGFQESVLENANKHNLDPAWIFAITRQESAFATGSLSYAGARGLMQLLPTTAEMMAKKYDITYPSADALYQADTNIQLGSVYLKNLKQRMQDHIILATASYNAGPERIKRWLPEKETDPEIWVETIPYQETREYVKNVLAFTSIYRHRLGYPTAFALMIKPIPTKEALTIAKSS